MRIGLIADTHEATDAPRLIRRLADLSFHRAVHLGDVASSPLVVRVVREFKRRPDWIESLSEEERHRMAELRQQGRPPVAAYLEARIAHNPVLRQQRYAETLAGYREIVAALATVPGMIVVAGNIDRGWLRNADILDVFRRAQVRLAMAPEVIDAGSRALLLWPSFRVTDHREALALSTLTAEIVDQLRGKSQVIVLGHEHLFRGPTPARYLENVARVGLTATTVPHYEPNPTRHQIAALLRALPPTVQTCFVFGHVHDSMEVIQAGVGYLRRTAGGGLTYRIGGGITGGPDRRVETFCVPVDRIAELVADDSGFRFKLLS